MTTRIRFGSDVPHWLRRLARRWFRLLLPDDWRMHVQMQDVDDLEAEHGEGTRAVAVSLTTYLDLAICFADDLANEPDAWRTVAHEISHARFQPFTDLFAMAWDGRRKMKREDVAEMLAALIEQMIQRDVAILAKIMKLP